MDDDLRIHPASVIDDGSIVATYPLVYSYLTFFYKEGFFVEGWFEVTTSNSAFVSSFPLYLPLH